jgi:hypothetical protein
VRHPSKKKKTEGKIKSSPLVAWCSLGVGVLGGSRSASSLFAPVNFFASGFALLTLIQFWAGPLKSQIFAFWCRALLFVFFLLKYQIFAFWRRGPFLSFSCSGGELI